MRSTLALWLQTLVILFFSMCVVVPKLQCTLEGKGSFLQDRCPELHAYKQSLNKALDLGCHASPLNLQTRECALCWDCFCKTSELPLWASKTRLVCWTENINSFSIICLWSDLVPVDHSKGCFIHCVPIFLSFSCDLRVEYSWGLLAHVPCSHAGNIQEADITDVIHHAR